jgi:hypothetical protein
MGRELTSQAMFGAAAELREEAAKARYMAATMNDAAAVRDLLAYADALENDVAPLEQMPPVLTSS